MRGAWGLAWLRLQRRPQLAQPGVDRLGSLDEGALLLGHAVTRTLDHGVAHFHVALELLGRGDIGHGHIVVGEAVLGALETGGEVEDRALRTILLRLARDHAAVGEAAAVEIARGGVGDVEAFLAAAQEIGVERMRLQPFGGGRLRGLQCLRDDLTAKYAAHAAGLLRGSEGVLAPAGDGQQADEACDELFRFLFRTHPTGFAGGLRLRQASTGLPLPERIGGKAERQEEHRLQGVSVLLQPPLGPAVLESCLGRGPAIASGEGIDYRSLADKLLAMWRPSSNDGFLASECPAPGPKRQRFRLVARRPTPRRFGFDAQFAHEPVEAPCPCLGIAPLAAPGDR